MDDRLIEIVLADRTKDQTRLLKQDWEVRAGHECAPVDHVAKHLYDGTAGPVILVLLPQQANMARSIRRSTHSA